MIYAHISESNILLKYKLQIKWRNTIIRNCTMWFKDSLFQYFKMLECPDHFWNVWKVWYSEWIIKVCKYFTKTAIAIHMHNLIEFQSKGLYYWRGRIITSLQYSMLKGMLRNMKTLLFKNILSMDKNEFIIHM